MEEAIPMIRRPFSVLVRIEETAYHLALSHNSQLGKISSTSPHCESMCMIKSTTEMSLTHQSTMTLPLRISLKEKTRRWSSSFHRRQVLIVDFYFCRTDANLVEDNDERIIKLSLDNHDYSDVFSFEN